MTARTRRRPARLAAALTAGALILAACSGDDGTDEASETDAAPSPEDIVSEDQLREYLDQADGIPLAESDAAVAPGTEPAVGGAPGYSRYVFRDGPDGVLPSLVEGPLGQQVRCQDVELPCSYEELVDLEESGDPIPEGLDLTAGELTELVDQLGETRAVTERYADVDDACADGYFSDRTQTPNMGSHFTNPIYVADGEFDPSKPEILIYARPDGTPPEGQLGQCRNGVWDGDELEIVATSFILPRGTQAAGDDHPEAFTGDFDNWHVHYNLCRGAGTDSIVGPETCEESGGRYSETIGWMIHAWVAPDHDNQLGVFSMWNPTVWPISDPEEILDNRVVRPSDAPESAAFSPIQSFSFGSDPITVDAGDPVVWSNSDSVPHTVTGGSSAGGGPSAFDSGVFAPGQNFETTFAEAGEYDFFCTLHPDMTGTVIVED